MKVATLSIQDNDTPVQLEFGGYWAAQGEGSVLIGMVRGGEGEALTLDYATANGTALAGEDTQRWVGRSRLRRGTTLSC